MAHRILDVVSKDKEKDHVEQQMQNASMQEHIGQELILAGEMLQKRGPWRDLAWRRRQCLDQAGRHGDHEIGLKAEVHSHVEDDNPYRHVLKPDLLEGIEIPNRHKKH